VSELLIRQTKNVNLVIRINLNKNKIYSDPQHESVVESSDFRQKAMFFIRLKVAFQIHPHPGNGVNVIASPLQFNTQAPHSIHFSGNWTWYTLFISLNTF
jgi:hypothetical protein